MGNIRKHKRIFYRPGMISMVCIPLLCLYFFYKNDSFKVYGVLKLDLVPDQENFDKYKFPTLRKYRVFNFNGSESIEKRNLEKLKFFLRKLVIEKDTIVGIRTHFGPKTHFGVFVNVIDILNTDKAPTFAPYKDVIYVLASSNTIKSSNTHRMNCGTAEATRINYLKYQELDKEKSNLLFMNSFLKQQWILFLSYFGIVILNPLGAIKLFVF